jgi:hypothetical protein
VRHLAAASIIGVALWLAGCGAAGPSDVPPVSRLYYDKPADAESGTGVGRWATTNASFGARLFTPSLLMMWVLPTSGGWCQLELMAPEGETLTVRSYLRASRMPSIGVAGLAFSCGRAACASLDGNFTLHRLDARNDGVITTMHATFEQTCNAGGSPLGRLTGEAWIVNGVSGAPAGFPGA